MKRIALLIVSIAAIAISASGATPSDGYSTELLNRDGIKSTIKPQVEVNVGYITGGKLKTNNFGKLQTNLSRPYVEAIVGARLNDYLFAGVGVGLQYAYGDCKLLGIATENSPETWGAVGIPIYLNIRGCYPVSRIVTPYISVGIGGDVVVASNFAREGYGKLKGGLMMKFGAGITISRFNIGLGLASQSIEWKSPLGVTNFKAGNNAFYVEAGVSF